ncbi:MAG: hypothetical protein GTO24_20435, partial [candidate division Zixibacteria bacterium]|nr:hypothetical protein [candidate division Zixibacteria bacterium]
MINPNRPFSRRDFLISLSSFAAGASIGFVGSRHWLFNYTEPGKQYMLQRKQEDLARRLLPPEGKAVSIVFQDSLKKLVEAGVIDLEKWNSLYSKRRMEVPDWIATALFSPSEHPIQFDKISAPFLLNLLWALGISNKTRFNERSPLRGKRLPNFASTGGWKLGREQNGAAYFNQVANILLNQAQEQQVFEMAKDIYRPCCNNSTFFQDCNHGSAMLGLLELGASQGKREEELYAIALTANTYWFPERYLAIAFYLEEIEVERRLKDVPPRELLSSFFSSAQGFTINVLRNLEKKSLPTSNT